MKLILVSALLLIAVITYIEAQDCIAYENVCNQGDTNCCEGTVCKCYRRLFAGVKGDLKCWCIDTDVKYTNL
nr:venom protein [Lampona murina]